MYYPQHDTSPDRVAPNGGSRGMKVDVRVEDNYRTHLRLIVHRVAEASTNH